MPNQITLEEALVLVDFELRPEGWRVKHVKSSVYGSVLGSVWGNILGSVWGRVWGSVHGTIGGHHWKFIEAATKRLQRLIKEGADKAQLLKALEQLEDSNG